LHFFDRCDISNLRKEPLQGEKMGITQSLITEQEPPIPPNSKGWFQIIVALSLYLAIFFVGYHYTEPGGEKWWVATLAVIACHIFLSIVVINERQLGAMFVLGHAIRDLKSGPHFAFWPLCYVRRETKNIIQIEIGVLTEAEKAKATTLVSSESIYLLEDPFYVNWGDINSAKGVTDEEKDRFKDNPYGRPMVTATHLTVRFEIWSLTGLIKKAGSLSDAVELIQKVATSTLITYAGKSFVGRALSDMGTLDDDLKLAIEEFVADPHSRSFKSNPNRSWGVNIRKTQITRLGTAKRISEAQADQGKTIYNAQAERIKTEELAIGQAKATELKANADQIRLTKEGIGRAEAEKLLLLARKGGLEELAKIAKTTEGQLVLQLEALERGLQSGKAIIIPMELSKIVGALGNKLAS